MIEKRSVSQKNESSIAWLESEIVGINKQKNARSKENQAEKQKLQSRLNKVYAEYKCRVMELEERNFSNLILLRSTKGFYKLFGHSMFFYAFEIAPKLEIEARVYADGDFEAKSEYGMCSIANLAEFEKNLLKLEIKRMRSKSSNNGNLIIYKLPWEYSQKDLDKLVEQNEYMRSKYNHVIMATNMIPMLYVNLNDLLKACYENVRRLEVVARETMGNMVVELVAEMMRIYIEMGNGRINELKAMAEMRVRLNKIKSQVKILADLKLWNANAYARIGEIMIKVQAILDSRIKIETKV